MKCDNYEPLLTAYVLGDLDEKARQELSVHMESCAQCRAELEMIQSTIGDVKQALQVQAQAKPHLEFKRRAKILGTRKRHRITVTAVLKLAATVVILIGVAGLFMPAMSRSRERASLACIEVASTPASFESFQELPETSRQPMPMEAFDKEEVPVAAPGEPAKSGKDGGTPGWFDNGNLDKVRKKQISGNGPTYGYVADSRRLDEHAPMPSSKSVDPDMGRLKNAVASEQINGVAIESRQDGAFTASEPNPELKWNATPSDVPGLLKKMRESMADISIESEDKPAEDSTVTTVATGGGKLGIQRGELDTDGVKEGDETINQATPDMLLAGEVTKGDNFTLTGESVSGNKIMIHKEENGRSKIGRSGSDSKDLSKRSDEVSRITDDEPEAGSHEGLGVGSGGAGQAAQIEVAKAKSPLVMKGLYASRLASVKPVVGGVANERNRKIDDRIQGGDSSVVSDMKKAQFIGTPKPAVSTPATPATSTFTAGTVAYIKPDIATNSLALAALQTRMEDVTGDLLDHKDVETAVKAIYPQQVFNPVEDCAKSPFSTFGIDVDTASFTLARRYLLGGQLPPAGAIRVEEFVNAFDYAYPSPERKMFAVYTDRVRSPFRPNLELLRIGVRGKVLGRDRQRPSALTFVIDTSGSMNMPDRLPLIQKSLLLLVDQLTPRDTVTMIAFGSGTQLVLDQTPASQKDKIRKAINNLQTYGSTQMEGGIRLGYEMAARHFKSGGMNRVLILSDGVANLGAGTAEEILAQVESFRKKGIYCSVFGFGQGNYNDVMLQTLADKGDGVYRFVDSLAEARHVFVDDLSATLHVIARDVKIQVEFDSQRVKSYRQLGYEKRHLQKEQFRDDTVDAGEVGSGQSATALYELEVTGNPIEPLGTVRVRWKDVESGQVEEMAQPVKGSDVYTSFEEAPVRFKLAAGLAELAELLRGSPYAGGTAMRDVGKVLRPVGLELSLDRQIKDLIRMVEMGEKLKK